MLCHILWRRLAHLNLTLKHKTCIQAACLIKKAVFVSRINSFRWKLHFQFEPPYFQYRHNALILTLALVWASHTLHFLLGLFLSSAGTVVYFMDSLKVIQLSKPRQAVLCKMAWGIWTVHLLFQNTASSRSVSPVWKPWKFQGVTHTSQYTPAFRELKGHLCPLSCLVDHDKNALISAHKWGAFFLYYIWCKTGRG